MNEIEDTIALADTLSMKAYELGLEYAPKLALAIVTLIIGLWVISGVRKLITLSMKKLKS